MSCPDDLELARFLDRTLAHDRARALEEHFDRCRECRRLAFALADPDSFDQRPPIRYRRL